VKWWGFVLAFAVSVLITGLLRAYSVRLRLIDIPNQRSSHSVPVPRGGGLAIALVSLLGLFAAWFADLVDARLLVGVGGAGFGIGLVGLLDDRFSIRASVRLLVHILGAAWFMVWCWQLLPAATPGDSGAMLAGWAILILMGIVSAVNIFNFMDGIDGLGGGQGVFLASTAVWLLSAAGGDESVAVLLSVVVAASVGFLLWNLSAARIFLGDVGSGFLGFILAALPLVGSGYTGIPVATWLILWGVFVADAGTTLIRRIIRRDRWYAAHRSHAYQVLARRLASHQLVTLIYLAVDVAWLLPLAWWSIQVPQYAELVACLALAPLLALAWHFDAGAPENGRQPIP
jgi:Fuc2NAc and GlcNAc transferase